MTIGSSVEAQVAAALAAEGKLVHIDASKSLKYRHNKDFEVEQKGPVFNVKHVVGNALDDLIVRTNSATASVDLRKTRNARLYLMPQQISVDDLTQMPVASSRSSRMRAWTHKRHLSFDNIEELRKFVETGTPQPSPDPCNPAVVPDCLLVRPQIPKLVVQCAEFQNMKSAVPVATSRLPEEYRALTVKADGDCSQQHDRQRKNDESR